MAGGLKSFLYFYYFSSLFIWGNAPICRLHIFSDGWLNIPNRSVFDTPFFSKLRFFVVVAGFSLRF